MKTKFKVLLNEDAAEYHYNYKGKDIITTKHSVARDLERWPLTKEQKVKIFQRSIDALLPEPTGQYLIFSRSLRYGLVYDYRPDYKSRSNENQLIVITVLAKDRNIPKENTTRIFVESNKWELHPDGEYSNEFSQWITDVLDVPLTEGEGIDVKEINKFDMRWILVYDDNKLHNVTIDDVEIIEVE